jgi:mannosyltransferase OCH1-like enzyme
VIPRILHQIWLGPDPLPEQFARYTETWRKHHPTWEMRMWTEENLPRDLRRKEAADRLRAPAERSDILRLELLFRHGGVYVDTDVECRAPIDDVLAGVEFFVAELKPGRVGTATMGSVAHHPLLDEALDAVRPREFYGFDKSVAGPDFVAALVDGRSEVTVFERHLFDPPEGDDQKALAVHHHARSWKDDAEWKRTALTTGRRLKEVRRELDDERRQHAAARREIASLKAQLAAAREGRGRARQIIRGLGARRADRG